MWSKKNKAYVKILSTLILFTSGFILANHLLLQNRAETPPSSENAEAMPVLPQDDSTPLELKTSSNSSEDKKQLKPDLSQEKGNSVYDRLQAVLDLRQEKSAEAIKHLVSYLDDPDRAVAMEAIDALRYIGKNSEYGEMVFNILKKKVEDPLYPFRSHALISASRLGMDEEMMPLIEDFVAEDTDGTLSAASRAMNFIASEECIPYIETILDNTSIDDISRIAMNVLRKIDTPKSHEVLSTYLSDENVSTQNLAVWALSRTDSEANKALLINAIHSDTLDREGLGIVVSSPAAGNIIQEAFEDEATTKTQMLNLLEAISENTSSGNSKTRNDTAAQLSTLLSNDDEDIVAAAAQAMAESGANQDQTAALEPILNSENPTVQENALKAYAQYCTSQTYKPLLELVWDDEQKISRTAFLVSSNFVNESDRSDLEKAMDHPDEFISKQAKILLNNIE